MSTLLERALAYLDALEADRRAALALSEQKAEEARLIKARHEGFQAAMEMLGGENPVGNAEADPEQPGRRRARRRIPQLILRELSFSGQAMSASQIAVRKPDRQGDRLQYRANANSTHAPGESWRGAAEWRGPLGNRHHSHGSTP